MARSVFGTAFDRVVVINLDRRADRMSSVREQLAKLGVDYTRHPAIDGKDPEVAKEWHAYMRGAAAMPDQMRQVNGWRDFYLGDKPHSSRVAFFETERKSRGISTPGAWGLFRSMRRVIEKALADKVGSLLILEDDVRFHRDTIDLWPKVLSELPADWQVLQLGAMQTHWEDNWIDWHSQHLYKCQGSSFAAHAIALKTNAMRAVIARSKELDLPFDIGALQEAKRLYRGQCYTAYPNLVIQDTQDSEIGMSQIFEREAQKADNKYRWHWPDYVLADLRPFNTQWSVKSDQAAPTRLRDQNVGFLQPYSVRPGSAERVIVIFGPDTDASAEAYIKMLKEQKDDGDIAPIVLIDSMHYIPALREAELAFEYVPTAKAYREVLRADRDPRMVVERRLSIIRRKWLPRRIIALGDAAQSRLDTWRASPFEQSELGADLATDEDLRGMIE